jgi:phage terminase large subunit GpA-like protein
VDDRRADRTADGREAGDAGDKRKFKKMRARNELTDLWVYALAESSAGTRALRQSRRQHAVNVAAWAAADSSTVEVARYAPCIAAGTFNDERL